MNQEDFLVTNSSYRKTINSSRAIIATSSPDKPNIEAKAHNLESTNKFVAGEVQYHRIQKGDTLGAISKKYGTSVNKLCNLNNINSRTVLRVGKSIRVT